MNCPMKLAKYRRLIISSLLNVALITEKDDTDLDAVNSVYLGIKISSFF